MAEVARRLNVALLFLSLMAIGNICYAQSKPDISSPAKEWPKEYRGVWFVGASCDEVTFHIAIYANTGFRGSPDVVE
jgi:hypothetical protein